MRYYRPPYDGSIPVSLLKDYAYCPRLAYLRAALGPPPPTNTMLLNRAPERQPSPERALREAGLEYTRIEREVCGRHPRLGIRGCADAVAWLRGGGLAVVEAKAGRWRGRHHLLQAAGYALIVEHVTGERVRYLVLAYKGRTERVEFTAGLARMVERAVEAARSMLGDGPPRAVRQARCGACFYRKVCW